MTAPPHDRDIEVFTDAAALVRVAAERVVRLAAEAVERAERFTIALSGGSTPRPLYELLAGPFRDRLPWARTEIFFGDERCVPPTDPQSNYFAARRALLVHVPLARVYRIEGELPAEEAAANYDATLRAAFPDDLAPTFDLVLLGVGPDGHTASLFPGSPALDERERWAVAVPAPTTAAPALPRVTMTLPPIERAREVWLLAAGADKRDVVARILDRRADDLPAARAHGALRTSWLLDRAARGG